jgi:peptide/nickel transport system ATP-binding protein
LPSLLEVKDLHTRIRRRRAEVHAVDGVSFEVRAGETVGLVGESGCGKSMTGLSIMDLLPPGGRVERGSIRLEGRELVGLGEAAMRPVRGNEVAMVFQDPMTSLNPTMTIGSQVAESVRAHRSGSRQAAMERALEVLSLVGMPRPGERLHDYPHQLSGGMRQRVLIAIALACQPKLLIADEPTTALDVTIQAQILALLDDLKARLGMGMLLITHDLGVIAGRADRVLVMYAGQIVEEAPTVELFGRMRHRYTEALLESIPSLDEASASLPSIPGLPPDLARPPPGCRFAPRCGHALERCRTDVPPQVVAGPDHAYACWVPVELPRPGQGCPAAPAPAATHGPEGPGEAGPPASPVAGPGPSPPSAAGEVAPLVVLSRVVKEFPVTAGVLRRKAGGVKAVSDVSFGVRQGETFGVVGESGCGKTTLGRLMVALERPDSGSITFDGVELSSLRGRRLREMRRDLQLIFQDPYASLDPRMRVGPALREPMAIQGIGTPKQRQARIAELLSEVGLSPRAAELYPHEFSGGQRQRIGFARALTLSPRLVVADEPVSALDVSIRSQLLNLMKQLQADFSLTYMIISHDLSVVRYLADRVAVMYLGKVVELGQSRDLYERPAHPYTLGLLDAVPLADPARERAKSRTGVQGELPSAIDPPSGCRFRTRCPRAEERCALEEPPMRPFGPGGHQAACHFPLRPPLSAAAAGPRTSP